MRLRPTVFAVAASLCFAAGLFSAAAQPSNAVPQSSNNVAATAPVYVPDYSHSGEPLPDGVIAWDELMKASDATNGQESARFTFSFTNIATTIKIGPATTNVITTTNITAVTNSSFWGKKIIQGTSIARSTNIVAATNAITPVPVTILNVRPSCGCTTAELPPVPWMIPPGSNGQIKITVNLAGKTSTVGMLFKSIAVTTDKGMKNLILRINVLPPPPPKPMSEEERARGIAASKIDRQAVFKGDCRSCHVKNIEGKYGQQLFDAACAICHESNPRASMVPDLHNLPVPTSEEFWRTWITAGKAGTLMPSFATSQGGPLSDLQIASLAAYLNTACPSRVPPPAAK